MQALVLKSSRMAGMIYNCAQEWPCFPICECHV